jgi:hypothetical protein
MKRIGGPIEFLSESPSKGPVYSHPMDKILREIQDRERRSIINIKPKHVFSCLVLIMIYLVIL